MRIFGIDIQRAGDLRGADLRKELRERVHRLEIAHSELVEHFNLLQGAHAKLRSIVHGDRSVRTGSRSGGSDVDPATITDKAQLRMVLGGEAGMRQRQVTAIKERK